MRLGFGRCFEANRKFSKSCKSETPTKKLLGQLEMDSKAARYGYPFATFHRADLHTLLLNALQ